MVSPSRRPVIGLRFGRLVVIAEGDGKARSATVRCDCGTLKQVNVSNLRRSLTQSCGCLHREATKASNSTHGQTDTPEYQAWTDAKARCYNPANKRFYAYGARGIRMCRAWRNDFEAFFAHIGPRPKGRYSLDRIDNSKGYRPGNVRWATILEQARNRRKKYTRHCKNSGAASPCFHQYREPYCCFCR